jgi:hypothetical protein
LTSEAEKMLDKARSSRAGWHRKELESLYFGFGFIIVSSRGPHDKVYHPDHPELITFLPRHNKIGEYNVDNAIKLIDRLIKIKEVK